jgi:transposase
MDVIFTPCAGLDVHHKTVMACRVTPDPTGRQADGVMERKACGTRTVDLLALSDGLVEAGITQVAMERTGESWKPGYNILAGDFTVCLVNAAHAKQVPGRKTDQSDARWLAKRMRHGLVQASFIPPVAPRDWRDLTRDRTTLVQERSREVNRVQGVLERAHPHLASVATDMMGLSGRAFRSALIEERADPATMAALAHGRMRSKIPLLEQALTGLVRAHHRQLLALQLAHIDFLDEQLDPLRGEITRRRTDRGAGQPLAAPVETAGPAERAADPGSSAAPMTFPQAVRVLDTMPGVKQRGAELLVAEWGIDMERFGTAARLAAWSGVAPGNDESAGKQRSGKTRKGNRALHRLDATGPRHGAPDTSVSALSQAPGRAPGRNAPSWPSPTRSWSVPSTGFRAAKTS